MAFTTFLLTALAASITALALPQPESPTPNGQPTTGGVYPLTPTAANITLYSDATCSTCETSTKDVLEANVCTRICSPSLSIPQVPDHDCMLVVYTGSSSCALVEGGERTTFVLGKGEGSLCVDVGVEGCDDGMEGGSGVWSCG